MNYAKLSLEELEELFLQQREHHYALTEAVRNSRDALASIMKAVNEKRKGSSGVSFDSEIEEMFQSIHGRSVQPVPAVVRTSFGELSPRMMAAWERTERAVKERAAALNLFSGAV